MKKDKEWALNELWSKINPANISYSNDAYSVAILIVSQIETPKPEAPNPLVVPKELAEWLANQSLGDEGFLFGVIGRLEDMWADSHFEDFIDDNKKELIEVILGTREYEVEKEQLYVLKLPYIDYFYTKVEEENRIGIGTSKSIKEMSSYHFTEKEILTKIPDIPKSLWIKLEDL